MLFCKTFKLFVNFLTAKWSTAIFCVKKVRINFLMILNICYIFLFSKQVNYINLHFWYYVKIFSLSQRGTHLLQIYNREIRSSLSSSFYSYRNSRCFGLATFSSESTLSPVISLRRAGFILIRPHWLAQASVDCKTCLFSANATSQKHRFVRSHRVVAPTAAVTATAALQATSFDLNLVEAGLFSSVSVGLWARNRCPSQKTEPPRE